MKEIASLLIATTCLALAGFGVYFFSSKSNDNDNKGGKNKRLNSKKKIENENDYSDSDSESDSDSDNNSDLYKEPIKNNKKQQSNKTRNIKSKFSNTRKKYY